jgi:hypothetical protein
VSYLLNQVRVEIEYLIHCMVYTVCERLIQGNVDMTEVEKTIVQQLGGENNRCAFFRTVPYIRLRIAALYIPNPTPHIAYYGDLSVMLTPSVEGPIVSVHCSHEPTYPDDYEASTLTECSSTSSHCQKRMRLTD